jgi:hypothetical protein
MGSLILLMLVIDRRARVVARAKAARAAITAAAEDDQAAAARQAEWERRRRSLHEQLAAEEAELTTQLQAVHGKADVASAAIKKEEARTSALQEQIRAEQTQLTTREKSLTTRQTEVEKSTKEAAAKQAELAALTAELARMEEALSELRALRRKQQQLYSVVPYRGKRGDNRKPIYMECAGDSLIFHPDRQVIRRASVRGPEIRAELIRRMAARQQEVQVAGTDRPGEGAYLMLLVRPNGITTYYRTLGALQGLQFDFGYEFVDGEWILDFPNDDTTPAQQPWMLVEKPSDSKPAVAPPGPVKIRVSGLSPQRYQGMNFSGPAGQGTGPLGAPGLPGQGPGGEAITPTLGQGPGGVGPASAFPPGLGAPGMRSQGPAGYPGGTPGQNPGGIAQSGPSGTGNGNGGGFGDQPVGEKVSVAPPPGYRPSTAATAKNSDPVAASAPGGSNRLTGGQPGPGGKEIAAGELSPNGQAPGLPGTPSGSPGVAPIGDPPVPFGPGQANALERSPDGKRGANPNQAADGGGTSGTSIAGPRGGPEGESGGLGAPGTSNSAAATSGADAKSTGRAAKAAPGPEPAEAGESGPGFARDPLGGLGTPKKASRTSSVRPTVLVGNRDWIIAVECTANAVVLPSTGQRIATSSFVKTDNGSEALLEAMQKMIARRQASVRPGEPPYRPMIRFKVRPDGLRTYYAAYPALEALQIPMSRENVEQEK